jgi:hypothetical protein
VAGVGCEWLGRDNLRGQKSLGPLKMSLEMAHKVIVPQKNMSRSFLNSGTLIVILLPFLHKNWLRLFSYYALLGRKPNLRLSQPS